MKNVRFEFTDADYELVTKTYKQYEKLAKDYDHKDFLFGLFAFVTIPIGFLVFSLAQRIINARFVTTSYRTTSIYISFDISADFTTTTAINIS